jgi:hypothetical protein
MLAPELPWDLNPQLGHLLLPEFFSSAFHASSEHSFNQSQENPRLRLFFGNLAKDSITEVKIKMYKILRLKKKSIYAVYTGQSIFIMALIGSNSLFLLFFLIIII